MKRKKGKGPEQHREEQLAVRPPVNSKPRGIPEGKVSVSHGNRLPFIAACLLIFVISFLVYANTLSAEFIWDDEYLILNNSQIKTFVHFKNIFRTYVGYGSENINNFYRPMQEISNMIDYFLWGDYPFGYHLTNVVLHALVAVMVFVLLFYISGDMIVACIAALLYGVHPVHTEAIAYIAGRADPLYAVFMLSSLTMFVRFVNKVKTGRKAPFLYIFSVIFFVLSLLSKEIIISMPLLLITYMLCFLRGPDTKAAYRKVMWSWIPYAIIVVVYGYLRLTVLSFADIAPVSIFARIPLPFRLLTFFRTVGTYFRLLVFPVGLHMERAIPISRSFFEGTSFFSLLMMIGIGWATYITYKSNRLVSFAIMWFFVNLLPVSNVIPINSFIAEHWIYMASVGPFLLVGLGGAKLYKRYFSELPISRFAFTCAMATIIFIYGRLSVIRNLDWKDEVSFFTSTLKYHPKNARLYLNLGNTYYEKKQIDKAIEQYRKAININKGYAVAYGNIGSAMLNKKKTDEAEQYLQKAIRLKDNYPIAHYNLGIVYYQKGKNTEAVTSLKKATEQLPQLYQAWNMLGRTYARMGQKEKAKEAFQRSLYIMPKQPNIRHAVSKLK